MYVQCALYVGGSVFYFLNVPTFIVENIQAVCGRPLFYAIHLNQLFLQIYFILVLSGVHT